MLKIHKGLKKKKKDKKNKHKEDDLFNDEELEKYRKEHSNQEASGDEHIAQPSSSGDQSDEWQKFKALTAGVDTILQKTQEDLDRIKSTSFFQRKAPPSQIEKQREEEQKTEKESIKASQQEDSDLQQSLDKEVHGAIHSESEDESEELEVDDTLFDTSYVDAVASGELKLAYIPDSPTEKEDDYDPFDTSYASKFIESNPKKRYLNLGCAVQVLSGRQSNTELSSPALRIEKKSPRRRPKPVDLLLTSFDEGTDVQNGVIATTVEKTSTDSSPVKTLLDEDPLFVADNDLCITPSGITPILPVAPTSTPVNPTSTNNKPQQQPPPPQSKLDFSDFEINKYNLVATSNTPTTITTTVAAANIYNLQKQPSNESTDDEFAQLAAESLARKSSVAQLTPNHPTIVHPTLIKSSLDAVTPTAESISLDPLQPSAAVPIQQEEIDPFDTSIVAKVILPGKQEIRLLEQELLSDIPVANQVAQASTDLDNDFNPRAEESLTPKPARPQQLPITQALEVEKIVSPTRRPDLLKIEEINTQVVKPLTPLTVESQDQSLNKEYDPFDTSHICGAPGRLELKLIENELTNNSQNKDNDFDPRKYETDHLQTITTSITHHILKKYSCNLETTQQQPTTIDILTGKEDDSNHIFSTPVEPAKYLAESPDIAYSDPFDTSIANNIRPGQVELKLLETELISKN